MSGYWIGLLTVPVIVGSLAGGYLLLAGLTRSLPIVSRTLSRKHTDGQRNALASVIGASHRAWHIGGGDNVLIFVRGIDHEKANEARELLNHEGPWATFVKIGAAIPAAKPGRKDAAIRDNPATHEPATGDEGMGL